MRRTIPFLIALCLVAAARAEEPPAAETCPPAAAAPGPVNSAREGVACRIAIPPGSTSLAIVEILRSAANLSGEIAEVPAEGTLLPDTYPFARGDSRQDLVTRMQAAQAAFLEDVWQRRASDLPYHWPAELVTLASILELEISVAGERARAAGVYVNRLRQGMRLQAGSTINYGLFTDQQRPPGWRINHNAVDIATRYNTFEIDGLPPGPIANPSRASLEAAANPARTEELYVVADGRGGYLFAATLAEHMANVRRTRERPAR